MAAVTAYAAGTNATDAVGGERLSVLYVSRAGGEHGGKSEVVKALAGDGSSRSVLADRFENHEKEIYLSPDRQKLAVTVDSHHAHGGQVQTYITDMSGKLLSGAQPGSFIAWMPDSSSALVFSTGAVSEAVRAIYFLGADGSYAKSSLPHGTVSADVHPVTRSVAYSLTHPGSDRSDLRIVDVLGQDALVREGMGATFAWLRWSPDGRYLAYMSLDPSGRAPSNRRLWVMDALSREAREVGPIVWNYPPQWSPDGSMIVYAAPETDDGVDVESGGYRHLSSNIWQYSVQEGKATKLTAFAGKRVLHPSFSAEGDEIAFVSSEDGPDDLWILTGFELSRAVSGGDIKYPILP